MYGPHFSVFASATIAEFGHSKWPTLASSSLEAAPERKEVSLD